MAKVSSSPTLFLLFVNSVLNIIEGLLVLRLALRLFNASTLAPFVRWLYETTDPLIAPFSGMFPSPQLTAGVTIEFSTIFAMIFYVFISYVVTEVLNTLIYFANRRLND